MSVLSARSSARRSRCCGSFIRPVCGEVGDHVIRHRFCRAARHLDTAALMPAGSLGAITAWAPAASATRRQASEVVRIGHAVQHQQERRFLHRVEQVLQASRRRFSNASPPRPVGGGAAAVEPSRRLVGTAWRTPAFSRDRRGLSRGAVLCGPHRDRFRHRRRVGAQARKHRVKTETARVASTSTISRAGGATAHARGPLAILREHESIRLVSRSTRRS